MNTRPAMYSRPDKPMTIPVIDRRDPPRRTAAPAFEVLAVDKATQCHTTPDAVAYRMVTYLGPVGDQGVLEPSAGTGQLIRALLNAGHNKANLTMIERHQGLADTLRHLGPVRNQCFLEYATEALDLVHFPRIIMNPPFDRVKAHVAAALSLLGSGGRDPMTLVALVPITYQHPEAVTIETLPDTTFALAKVNTKIIRIER